MLHRLVGNHEDAEDLAQETFVRAYGALERFRGDSELRTWLIQIAVNLVRDGGEQNRPEYRALNPLGLVPALRDGDVVMFDKTGTLTLNRMSVVAVYSGEQAYAIVDHKFTTGDSMLQPGDREERTMNHLPPII